MQHVGIDWLDDAMDSRGEIVVPSLLWAGLRLAGGWATLEMDGFLISGDGDQDDADIGVDVMLYAHVMLFLF